MGCPTFVEIGSSLTFSVTTHDPDTGVLTDADAVPTFRVYEDETGTAIGSGDMAKLDDANTTGLYAETLTCSAGGGYETGRTYTVYIEAIVDSDKGGIVFGFTAYDHLKSNVQAMGAGVVTAAAIAADAIGASEFAQGAADKAWGTATRVLTAGTNLNDVSTADVNAQCDLALSDYDGPTKAEMDTGHGLLATEAKQDILNTNVDTLLTRITANLFSGITKMAEWLGALAGKQAADATAITEIKATGAGSGTFDETADSQEAIADGAAGGGATAQQVWEYATRTLSANTNLNDPTAAAIADAICDELLSGHTDAGSLAKAISDILTDTNELQGDWTNTGRLDTILDTINVDAARLTAVRAAVLTDWINDGRLDLILDAVATASALSTHDGKIDTLTTTVGAAGAGLTDVGGMSTGMKAEVNAEVDIAIADVNLDHFAGADAPSAPEAGSWLGNLIEDDGGTWRFTQNALEQAPSGIGSNKYEVRGDVTQRETGEVRWVVWCEKNGQPEAITACTVKLVACDGDGTITDYAGATETQNTDDANKAVNGEVADPGFTVGTQDYLLATVTADGGTRIGIIPFKTPARTS